MSAAVIDTARIRRRAVAQRLCGVYAITPELDDTADLLARVDAALAGGVAAVQYRNKRLGLRERRAQAAVLAPLVRKRGALLIVNDDADIARDVNADGVHIGEDDGAIDDVRKRVGAERIVGVSCYNDSAIAERAVAAGADYIAFGSFFNSPVKPSARRADLALIARARHLDVPVVAIGGIDATNVGDLVRAGADAAAVISAVFASSDRTQIEAAARAIGAAMAGSR